MNWKLILLLSLTGIGIGFITVYFLPARYESFVSAPVFLLCTYLIVKYAKTWFFLHGLILGFLNTLLATIVRIVLSDTYLSNHPQDALQYAKMSEESGATVNQAMLLIGLFIAVISGITMALLALAGGKMLKTYNERGKGY